MPKYNLKQQRAFKQAKRRVTPYPVVEPVLPNEDFKKPKDLTIKHLNFSYKPKKLKFPSDPDFISYEKQIDPTDKKIIALATAITGRKRLDEILDRPAHGLMLKVLNCLLDRLVLKKLNTRKDLTKHCLILCIRKMKN